MNSWDMWAGRNDDIPDRKTRKKRIDAAKVVMITVPIGVCLALAVCILIYLRKRMKQKRSREIIESKILFINFS